MDINELRKAIDNFGALEVTLRLLIKAGLKNEDAELLVATLLDETADFKRK